MRYLSFKIENFRGIESAKIDLVPTGGGVFTLIGLNESGKTTVLEAISTFQIQGGDEKSLYQGKPTRSDPSSFVPKHDKATFTGKITVTAEVEFEGDERAQCIAAAEKSSGYKFDLESVANKFKIERGYQYENGDKGDYIHLWDVGVQVKEKGARKFRSTSGKDDPPWVAFRKAVSSLLPDIVYFPTFLFEQPDRIILNPGEKEKNVDRLYREIIQNVGLSLEKPIDVRKNIVDRITTPETPGEALVGWFSLSNNRQQQIDSAINQISQHLTDTVFDSWSKIFGKSRKDREIRLKPGVDKHEDGSPRVYLQFSIRDGTQQYDISERSLGFRWFFSFLLFTLYRKSFINNSKTLFLLDEPASNLHSRAQTQLLSSFPRIASNGNLIIYSTHSHYMINPEWLDQAFIVSNAAVDYEDFSDKVPPKRQHTLIKVTKYRAFVGQNPDKSTYFQPVLDRLQVVPSRLDALQPCVIVEGKGDYLILQQGLRLVNKEKLPYAIIPTRGADHLDEMVGILLGWGVKFCLCLDDDKAGRRAVQDFTANWGVPIERAFTIAAVNTDLTGLSLDRILSAVDTETVRTFYGTSEQPTKSQIHLFFSELLAIGAQGNLSEEFKERMRSFDAAFRKSLKV